jgi:bacterioferritin (cytochrome b1)
MHFVALTNSGDAIAVGEYSNIYDAEAAALQQGIDYRTVFDEYIVKSLFNELFEYQESIHWDELQQEWRGE